MKYLFYILLLILLTGLWAGLGPLVKIFGQVPQVLFLFVFVWSLEKQDEDYLLLALAAGLFLDFYTGLVVGSFTIPILIVCMGARILVENFVALELGSKYLAALLLPALVIFELLYFLTALMFVKLHLAPDLPSLQMLVRAFPAAFFYNLLLLYPISALVGFARFFVGRYIEREYKVR